MNWPNSRDAHQCLYCISRFSPPLFLSFSPVVYILCRHSVEFVILYYWDSKKHSKYVNKWFYPRVGLSLGVHYHPEPWWYTLTVSYTAYIISHPLSRQRSCLAKVQHCWQYSTLQTASHWAEERGLLIISPALSLWEALKAVNIPPSPPALVN